MTIKKSKAIYEIEEKMQDLAEGSLRCKVLECTKNFKFSWIQLGQFLVTVYNDKRYKEWGYSTFEFYCKKEVGIRKETALKLLRSYYFLEKEEPELLKEDYLKDTSAGQVPLLDAINTLRLAKQNRNINEEGYNKLKNQVLTEGRDEQEAKKSFRSLLESFREDEPEVAREKRRIAVVKRMVSTLNSLKIEVEVSKLLSPQLVNSLDVIIKKIEKELA
ncbi:MAG: hypothetical protein ABH952_01105 [Candidatus Omnitrophota bacterium]